MSVEEVKSVTWDFGGERLSYQQAIQRLARAGFPIWRINPASGKEQSPLLLMFAVVMGESGLYKEAWHINVVRNTDGTIARSQIGGKDHMMMKSIDLGFLQFNVEISPDQEIEMDPATISVFVQEQFAAHPLLAVPSTAAVAAYNRWLKDDFSPWYAYMPGTAAWHLKLKEATKGMADWLIHSFVGPDDTGKLPVLDWK